MIKVAIYVFFIIVLGIVAASHASAAIYSYSGTLSPTYNITIDLKLNPSTATFTHVTITGPADRWFAVGISYEGSMAGSQVLVYSNNGLEDLLLDGYSGGSLKDPQTATLLTNSVDSNIRTLTLTGWEISYNGYTYYLEDPDLYGPYALVWAVGQDMTYSHHAAAGSSFINFTVPEPASASLLVFAALSQIRRRRTAYSAPQFSPLIRIDGLTSRRIDASHTILTCPISPTPTVTTA